VSRLPVILLTALGVLLAAAPAAMAQKPDDVVRVENALVDLASTKKAAADEVAAGERARAKAMRKCESRGPGWERIRAVRVPAQRSLYRRGARALWRELSEVAVERAAFDAYRKPFERFTDAQQFVENTPPVGVALDLLGSFEQHFVAAPQLFTADGHECFLGKDTGSALHHLQGFHERFTALLQL
jgi:hypothetical protein